MDFNKITFHKLLEQKDPTLKARICVMKRDAQGNWLRALGKNDFSHSRSVENNLDRLVPDDIKETFDPAEIFALLYAVYLHDLGYLIDKELHEKSSYKEIVNNFQKYKLNDSFEAQAVASVCYGHAPEEEYPLKEIDDKFGIAGLSDNRLNLRFLAALFRLADEIDNVYTRVIGYPEQKESMRHLVRFVDIDIDRWLICFQTEPTNSDEWEKLDGMRKYTQKRLDELVWVIEPKGLLYNRIELEPKENPYTPPPPPPDDDISRLAEELSNLAFTLRDSIGCYKRSVKDKVAEIIELLCSGENLVLVLGEAGSGKSALLKHLYTGLRDSNLNQTEATPAKVVYLDVGSYPANSPEVLRELKLDLTQLFRRIASPSHLVLILDGLDETLGYEDAVQVWNNIILETTTIPNAQIVVSCREYDWANARELEPLHKNQKPKKILLHRWELSSVREALTKNNLPHPDEDLLELLRNPFLLDLYVEIADDLSDIDRSSLQTEADLYYRYWDLRVSTERPPATVNQMIQAVHWLTAQAEKKRTQRFDHDALSIEHPDGAEGLKRNSVILSDRRGVYFRHPLILDYAIIRRRGWLTNPDKLADLLREASYNPFLRSSIFMMIRFLMAGGEWNQVQSLLCATVENPSVGWITNLLDFLARSGWSIEMSKCLEGYFGTLPKDTRRARMTTLVSFFPSQQPEWCNFFLALPEDWIAEEEGTSLHKAVSDFMKSLVDKELSQEAQALLISAGQRLEGIVRNIQINRQREDKEWTDWPVMRYIYVLGKTKNPDLIDWLLEVASLSWERVKMECMDQVPWVADEKPSAGAQLMALSLSFPDDVLRLGEEV